MNLTRYVLRRARSDARLLAGAAVAIVVALVAVSAAPVYLRSLEKAGVNHRLDVLTESRTAFHVNTSWLPLEQPEFQESDALVDAARDDHVADVVVGKTRFVKSRAHLWNFDGLPPKEDITDSRSFFHLISDLDKHVDYVEGRPPSPDVMYENGTIVIEAAVYARRAAMLNVKVGDVIDNVAEEVRGQVVKARVSGAFQVRDPRDVFWLDLAAPIIAPGAAVEDRLPPLSLFTSGESIIDGVGAAHGGLPGSYSWFIYTNHDVLGEMEAGQIVEMTDGFESQIESDLPRGSLITALDNSFIDLGNRLIFARIPMLLMAALALSAVAYYLFLVGGLLARRRASETLMLRSRGLNYWQITVVQSIESVFLIGVPIVLTPLAGLLLVSQIGRLPVYHGITGGGALPVEFTWVSYLWAFGGGIVVSVILLAPVLLEARRGVVEGVVAGEARPDRPPFFQRYFLDVLILALGGLVWWELRSRGSVVAGEFGERSADMTLLFFPAIFLVGAALIFLRVFPLVVRLSAWIAARTTRAWLVLGFWRLGRSPYWYTWPVILLVLAAGLGVISGTVASTLELSNEERISYHTAGDLRLTPGTANFPVNDRTLGHLVSHESIVDASPVYRTDGRIGTTGSGQIFHVLAIDPASFGNVSWFREDFANLPLGTLLNRIHVDTTPQPLVLPAGSQSLAVWAKASPRVQDAFLWMVFRGGNGAMDTVTFGQVEGEWTRLTARTGNLSDPVQLVSIQLFEPTGPDSGTPTTLLLDDLVVIDASGRETLVLDFELKEFWTGLPTSNGLDTQFALSPEDSGTGHIGQFVGKRVGQVAMGRGVNGGIRGIYRSASDGPIPMLGSRGFDSRTQTPPNQPIVVEIDGHIVPAQVVGTVDMFPTLHPTNLPYLIVDIDALRDFLSIRATEPMVANEVLIDAAPGRSEEAKEDARSVFFVSNIQAKHDFLERSLIDPLVVAGWRGMGFVATAIAMAAVALGYATYMTAHERRTRNESAFLLALGFPRRAFLLLVLVEHALISVLGTVLGIAAGVIASRITISSIAHTQAGGELIPPFVPDTNWTPVGLVILIMAVITVLAVVTLRRAYPNLPIHELTSARG